MKEWILRIIIKTVGGKMLKKLIGLVSGYKTYITVILGIIMAIVGHYMGPVDLPGPTDIPYIDSKTMWEVIWAGLTALFLRNGISKATPMADKPIQ